MDRRPAARTRPLGDDERRAIVEQLFPNGMARRQFFTRFVSLMMLSTAIAVFGILGDSTAVVIAVTLAAVISFLIPGRETPLPAELMARTSPNLLDLGIALAAGAAGAYGQVRRHAADVLTGVAVAVALVPPLAVVGITLQLTEWQLAIGASLLFLANVVVASSITTPLVDSLARRLAEHLSAPVRLRLLVVSADAEHATATP